MLLNLLYLGGGACGGLLCLYYLNIYLCCGFVLSEKTNLVSCVFAARLRSYPITLDKLDEKPVTLKLLHEELLELKQLILIIQQFIFESSHIDCEDSDEEF